MRKWPGKFVIGLTGNIASGKSVVRRMLEHLGAYGIDADALGHRAIARGAPGYRPVIDLFGRWVLTVDEQIDRRKLASIVFEHPDALIQLEKIIHPLVAEALNVFVSRSTMSIVVIEAIKLIEAGLHRSCDSVWVTYAPPDIQMTRLVENRRMSEEDARLRIKTQSPQETKMSIAHVLIRNTSNFTDTWKQVYVAWEKVVPVQVSIGSHTLEIEPSPPGKLSVLRGSPRESAQIAGLFNRLIGQKIPFTADDVMAEFGEKAFLLLKMGDTSVGLIGWQVENLVTRTTEIVVDPVVSLAEAVPILINEMEHASKELQCEASLVFVPLEMNRQENIWLQLGYERRLPQTLNVPAWQEACLESMTPGSVLYFKQLRSDRVLRPI